MASPVTGGVRSGGGGVTMHFEPPVEFILRQSGLFKSRLLDLMPLWERFIPVVEQIEQEQFDTQGHGAWPGLAESTMIEKERYGYPADPLIRSGALRDSLTSAAAAKPSPRQLEYGTDVDYAHWHQTGGYVSDRPPIRQVIPDPFPAEDRRKLEGVMVEWINETARETFGRIAA